MIVFCLFALALSGCGCPYTEKDVSVPDFLQKAVLVMEQDEYAATGNDPECCTGIWSPLKALGVINNEIIERSTIANTTVGREYFEHQGRKVELLPKGKRFSVVRIIAKTKHGIEAVDSGPGPIDYLVLKDEAGVFYKLAIVSLGTNKGEPYMAYYINGVRQGFLDVDLGKQLRAK